MNIFVVSSVLLLFLVRSVLSADGDVDSNCASGDSCTDSNAFCDTTDAANKKCTCHSGYVQNGKACARGWGRPCDAGMCLDHGVCTDDSKCGCDTSKNYPAGSVGDISCTCAAGTTKVDGKCLKKVGQQCSSTDECIATDGMVCADRGGSMKCTCDTSKNYDAGADNATSCSCDANSVASGTKCLKKVGQSCSSADECIATDGMVCAERDGSNKCTCDTNKKYDAGSDNDTTCSCEADHVKKSDKTCGLVIDQTCANDADCIDNARCQDDSGLKCKCDTSKNYAAGSVGATSCSCATNYAMKEDKSCGLVIDETCANDADCIDNARCQDDSGLKCKCDTSKNFGVGTAGDTSCTCDATKAETSGDKCLLKVGQPCSSTDQCIMTDGMVCADRGGTMKCTCDTTKNYAAGADDDNTCSCDATKAQTSGGKCLLKVNQPCSSTDECFDTDGMVCADRGGSNKCTCDTSKNYTAGADDAISCACAANHHKRSDKSCGLVIGQDCTAGGTPCIDNAVCSAQTAKCTCDPAKFFAAGADDDVTCSCDTSIAVDKVDGSCGLKVGKTCARKTAANVCGPHATCNTASFLCSCGGGVASQNKDGTCSSAPLNAVTSLGLLTFAVLVASCHVM